MADGDSAFNEPAWHAQMVDALDRALLKKYNVNLRRPIIMRRQQMDAPVRVMFPPPPGPPQIWLRASDSETARQSAFVQALAGVAVQQLPGANEAGRQLGSEPWQKIVQFLRGDSQAACVVEIGLPPDLLVPALPKDVGDGGKVDSADASDGAGSDAPGMEGAAGQASKKAKGREPIEWVTGRGSVIDLSAGIVVAKPINEKLAKEANVVSLKKLFAPRSRVWWTVSSAGPVAAADLDQMAAKNYASGLSDTTPYGSVKFPLRQMIKNTRGVKTPITSDVVLLLGYPPSSPSAVAVAAAGLWRKCKRVGGQLQYQVQIPFVWSDMSNRGVFRKVLVETMAQLLAQDLDAIAETQHKLLKLDSVVARLAGEPALDTCYVTMEMLLDRFDKLCKKKRGGVAFGGVDSALVMPPMLAALRRK